MDSSGTRLEIPSGPLRPGEPFTGRVHLRAPGPWEARRMGILLEWKAINQRAEKGEEVAWHPLVRPGTTIPARAEYEFRLFAPVMPWSYNGCDVRIEWRLSLCVNPRRGRAFHTTLPIEIRPGGQLSGEPGR